MQQQKIYTHGALVPRDYPRSIPPCCKWLGSEGYGVWFLLTKEDTLNDGQYRIRRYKDTGVLDCDRIFKLESNQLFDINKEFEFGYISHCQECVVYQANIRFVFTFLKEFKPV